RHTGTRRRGTEEPWHTVTAAHGIRIAWLACTLHTNFGRDHHDQVLDCFDKEQRVARLVGELRARPDIDAVIVTPHWGASTRHDRTPNKSSTRSAGSMPARSRSSATMRT